MLPRQRADVEVDRREQVIPTPAGSGPPERLPYRGLATEAQLPTYRLAGATFRTSTSVKLLSEPRQIRECSVLFRHIVFFSDQLANCADGQEHSERGRRQRLKPLALVKSLAARNAGRSEERRGGEEGRS